MKTTIKVGYREMTVAEARELYGALREVFAEKTGLAPPFLIKEWTGPQDEAAKRIEARRIPDTNQWPMGHPFAG